MVYLLLITRGVTLAAVFFGYNQYWPHGFMFFMSRSTRQVSTIDRATIGPLAKHHPNSGPGLDDGWAKVQLAVVLILKGLRRRGYGFKSHQTDWEKPGIETGPPGLQGIGYQRRNSLDATVFFGS